MAGSPRLLRYYLILIAFSLALFLVYFYTSAEVVSIKILKASSFLALLLAFLYIIFERREVV